MGMGGTASVSLTWDGDAAVLDGAGGVAAGPRREGSKVRQGGRLRRATSGARHPHRNEIGHRAGLSSDRVVGEWDDRRGAEGSVSRTVEGPREASAAAALRRRTGNLPPVQSKSVGRAHVRGGGRRRSKWAALDYLKLDGERMHEKSRHVNGGKGVADQHRRSQIAARRGWAHIVGEGTSAPAAGVVVSPRGAALAGPAPAVAVRDSTVRNTRCGGWESVATGVRIRLRSGAGAAQV